MTMTKTSFDPNWQETYANLVATPQRAVKAIKPGQRVFIGTGCGQPYELVRALVGRSRDLADIEIIHLLTSGEAPYATQELARNFRINSLFISDNVREIIQEGLGDYTPVFLSDIPRLFAAGSLPLDVALFQVTPPDERGMCSFGVSVDIVKAAAENASLVIAQVNRHMPRTLGDSFIHVNDMDILVPVDQPIIEVHEPEPDEDTQRIGEYVAALVEDGCTMELGIGRIPQAVLPYLKSKKDLGIHTEMFTDSIVDLIESGAVTGKYKTLDRGKVVASFCMGTRKLYDYVDNNPVFSFQPTEYVNDPHRIAQQHRMVAINVALEVDLTGQVCSDSLGSRFYSGIGGQVDFNRGAARSHGGKAIIALPSTAKDKSGNPISRIVGTLTEGAGVVTTRGDVHYVVTEQGVAYLHGKSVQERALALISVAHPSFREKLLQKAIDCKYVRPEHGTVGDKLVLGPQELRTTMLLDDGTQVFFRPIHPTDEPKVKELFYGLSQQTIYYRFMTPMQRIEQTLLQNFVFIDHRKDVAIVGTLPAPDGDEIIAIGRYYLDPSTNRAEVAFIVHDDWQDRGIGSFLLKYLISIARRNGIAGFTAEVLRDNKPMLSVLNKTGCKVSSTLNEGVYSYELDFA